jgi:hypothetical protein
MTPEEAYWTSRKNNIRNFDLEKIILQDPRFTYFYIENVIKGPWEEAEEIICNNPFFSVSYAKNILEGPFEKCHPYVFSGECRDIYYRFLQLIEYDIEKINHWLI